MESSSKFIPFLFISMLFLSSITPILGCGTCGKPSPKYKKPKTPVVLPPIKLPPIGLPPVGVLPPVTVPSAGGLPIPPVGSLIPPVGGLPSPSVGGLVPPVGSLPIPSIGGLVPPVGSLPIPPVGGVPIAPVVGGLPLPGVGGVPIAPVVGGLPLPPILNPPVTPSPKGKTCPSPPKKKGKCPINTLKLGACVDLLGGLVHVGVGSSAVNKCCPVLNGLAELDAAACLCTTLKVKLLNLKIYVPLALQLLVTCGKTPPPGYTCSL